jgi:hypothetical protein
MNASYESFSPAEKAGSDSVLHGWRGPADMEKIEVDAK